MANYVTPPIGALRSDCMAHFENLLNSSSPTAVSMMVEMMGFNNYSPHDVTHLVKRLGEAYLQLSCLDFPSHMSLNGRGPSYLSSFSSSVFGPVDLRLQHISHLAHQATWKRIRNIIWQVPLDAFAYKTSVTRHKLLDL